jgi:hypothetical protein
LFPLEQIDVDLFDFETDFVDRPTDAVRAGTGKMIQLRIGI